MLSSLSPLPIGNGVKAIWVPPAGTVRTRLLRKLADDFTGQNDPNAAVAFDGVGTIVIDTATVMNNVAYFYKPYYFDGSIWSTADSGSVTAIADAETAGPDVLELVRRRLQDGIKVEVTASRLVHRGGSIPVLTSPPAFEGTDFPIVTVHLRDDSASEGSVGNYIGGDTYDDEGDWGEGDGDMTLVMLDIIGWSTNADVRLSLRKAIKKILLGNDSVFAAAGMVGISKSFSDTEDMESYNSPMYQTNCSFRCTAPFVVYARRTETVSDLSVSVETDNG